MFLTKPIPPAIRAQLNEDPFMKECCLANEECEGRIEWHHFLKYSGKRCDEWFGILPCCSFHHRKEASYTQELTKVMCRRASYEELAKYSKAIDYVAIKKKYEN